MEFIIFVLWGIVVLASATSTVVETGYDFTCVLRDNEVRCWGHNKYGQLGLGHTTNLYEPPETPIDFGDFEPNGIGCGHSHCCVISTVHTLKCWGRGKSGALGYGDWSNRGDSADQMGDNLPEVELPSGVKAASVAMLSTQPTTCIVSTDGDVYCWGSNINGYLGQGHTRNIGDSAGEMGDNLIRTDLGSGFKVVKLDGSNFVFCAVSSGGEIKCWGGGDGYCLGRPSGFVGKTPSTMGDALLKLNMGAGFEAGSKNVGCMGAHCCAVSTLGGLKCWGRGSHGELGFTRSYYSSPTALIFGDDFEVKEIQLTLQGTCALSTLGELRCFGKNIGGQLGLGISTNSFCRLDSRFDDCTGVVDIGSDFELSEIHLCGGSGQQHVCVYQDSPKFMIKCWGRNVFGQLGIGDLGIDSVGTVPEDMGDNLRSVDVSVWPEPAPQCDATKTCDRFDVVENAVGRLDQDVQSLKSTMAAMRGLLTEYDTDAGMTSAPLGLTDDLLYALIIANVVMMVCLLVYCVCGRVSTAATYGKVLAYDTVDTEKA